MRLRVKLKLLQHCQPNLGDWVWLFYYLHQHGVTWNQNTICLNSEVSRERAMYGIYRRLIVVLGGANNFKGLCRALYRRQDFLTLSNTEFNSRHGWTAMFRFAPVLRSAPFFNGEPVHEVEVSASGYDA